MTDAPRTYDEHLYASLADPAFAKPFLEQLHADYRDQIRALQAERDDWRAATEVNIDVAKKLAAELDDQRKITAGTRQPQLAAEKILRDGIEEWKRLSARLEAAEAVVEEVRAIPEHERHFGLEDALRAYDAASKVVG